MSVESPTLKLALLELVVVVDEVELFFEPHADTASATTRSNGISLFKVTSGGFRLWDENLWPILLLTSWSVSHCVCAKAASKC